MATWFSTSAMVAHAYGGDMRTVSYDASVGAWSDLREMSDRHGTYKGKETPRGPYTANGLQVGPDGRLHIAWVFRERPCEPPRDNLKSERYCNHGLYYASSRDGGLTWHRADGTVMADLTKQEMISIANAGPEVVDLPKAVGRSNVGITSAVDPKTGDMHVLIDHHPDGGDVPTMHHYIGTPEGEWAGSASGFSASDARLAFVGDYLLVFEGRRKAAIQVARRKDGFRRWKEIPIVGRTKRDMVVIQGGYTTWDLSRLDEGLASVLWHTAPESGRDRDPSPIYVIDLKVTEL